jgi:hypothetical protein
MLYFRFKTHNLFQTKTRIECDNRLFKNRVIAFNSDMLKRSQVERERHTQRRERERQRDEK